MINLEMPQDVQSYVREYQGIMKARKEVGFYSQQKCIVAIVREHKELTDKLQKAEEELARCKKEMEEHQNTGKP